MRAHPAEYLAALAAAAPETGFASLAPDTFLSPGTLAAARRAAGAVARGVDMVMAGEAGERLLRGASARASCRDGAGDGVLPLRRRGDRGAACAGGARAGAVAIVDFDVHHGNGTQELVWDDRRVCFASTHQMPLYPGTGAADETGAFGQIVNVSLPPGAGGDLFRPPWSGCCRRSRRGAGPDPGFGGVRRASRAIRWRTSS